MREVSVSVRHRSILRPGRVREIINCLIRDHTFVCHETLTETGHETSKSQHCAGALILLERHDKPNQMMRISERLGGYNAAALDMAAPVFKSFGAMLAAAERQWKRDRRRARSST